MIIATGIVIIAIIIVMEIFYKCGELNELLFGMFLGVIIVFAVFHGMFVAKELIIQNGQYIEVSNEP